MNLDVRGGDGGILQVEHGKVLFFPWGTSIVWFNLPGDIGESLKTISMPSTRSRSTWNRNSAPYQNSGADAGSVVPLGKNACNGKQKNQHLPTRK